jgi:hypothetical protein
VELLADDPVRFPEEGLAAVGRDRRPARDLVPAALAAGGRGGGAERDREKTRSGRVESTR